MQNLPLANDKNSIVNDNYHNYRSVVSVAKYIAYTYCSNIFRDKMHTVHISNSVNNSCCFCRSFYCLINSNYIDMMAYLTVDNRQFEKNSAHQSSVFYRRNSRGQKT